MLRLSLWGTSPHSWQLQAGEDYTILRDHLQAGEFQKADDETRALLIRLAGPDAVKRGWVYFTEVQSKTPQVNDLGSAHQALVVGMSRDLRIAFKLLAVAIFPCGSVLIKRESCWVLANLVASYLYWKQCPFQRVSQIWFTTAESAFYTW